MAAKSAIQIEVFFTPRHVEEMQLKDKNVIVIDVLRASTTIVTALCNGAREIIPVGSIENAAKISGSLMSDVTLRAGERNAKMIEGFNLGNSPLEYREEVVRGKSIIFVTTNGSGAIVRGRHAKNLVVAGFVNISPVVDFFVRLNESLTIICAGKANNFCIEDAVCAGRIVNELKKRLPGLCTMDDAGEAAQALDKTFGKNLLKLLKNSEHGRYLSEIGFEEDLAYCGTLDTLPVLPLLVGNTVRLASEQDKKPSAT
jgi:2-phosphosulfolactate phosphatase